MSERSSSTLAAIVGFLVMGSAVAGMIYLGKAIWSYATGAGELRVTVAAGFVPAAEGAPPVFHVQGSVWHGSAPAETGTGWIELRRDNPPMTATLPATVQAGELVVPRNAAMAALAPEDTVTVTAHVTVTGTDGDTASGSAEATWGGIRTYALELYVALGVLVFLVLYFVTLYTGPMSAFKNRVQVATAYVIAALALFLPLAAPFALDAYPAFRARAAESAVGLLRVHRVGLGDSAVTMNQWAINIGGLPAKQFDGVEQSGHVHLPAGHLAAIG